MRRAETAQAPEVDGAWALGGHTSPANTVLLCERHHTQVHYGFRVERDITGRWHTYRRDGSEILPPDSHADPPMAAWPPEWLVARFAGTGRRAA